MVMLGVCTQGNITIGQQFHGADDVQSSLRHLSDMITCLGPKMYTVVTIVHYRTE